MTRQDDGGGDSLLTLCDDELQLERAALERSLAKLEKLVGETGDKSRKISLLRLAPSEVSRITAKLRLQLGQVNLELERRQREGIIVDHPLESFFTQDDEREFRSYLSDASDEEISTLREKCVEQIVSTEELSGDILADMVTNRDLAIAKRLAAQHGKLSLAKRILEKSLTIIDEEMARRRRPKLRLV